MDNKDYTHNNKAILIKGGRDYFDLLIELINDAKKLIYIQTYIFNEDDTGKKVAEALKNAAKRKIEVFVLIDGVSSQSLSKYFINSLLKSGIHFKPFEPIFDCKDYYFGRRLHQKVICIDNTHSLIGGLNIADRYNDSIKNKAWLDFAIYVKGDISYSISDYCNRLWKGLPYNDENISTALKHPRIALDTDDLCDVRLRRNDWIWHKNEISNSYIEMFKTAQNKIIILCSYFIPGKPLRRLLKHASERGINIKVITTNKSDVKITKYAERWLYDWLLRNKIELYEYKKNILHGKLAICDEDWFTIGSYNINNISTYASIELNLDVKNKKLTQELLNTIESIIQNDCIKVTIESHLKSKNMGIQFFRWLSYQFIRIVFKLFTFYFKRKN